MSVWKSLQSRLNLSSQTATGTSPPWSDMPHPAHSANIQMSSHHRSQSVMQAVPQNDVMADLVEDDFWHVL